MAAINSVTLVGHLTRDPELRDAGGTPVCDLGVAVNSREKRNGEWQDRADFVDVTVFGSQAESCSQFLAKGRQVAIDGRLRQDRWTNNEGENRSKVKVVAQTVQFLTKAEDSGGDGFVPDSAPAASPPQDDSEIPFAASKV